jgi:hypothetical protein
MNTQRTVICEGHSIHHYILAKQKVWIGQDNLHQIRAIQIFPIQRFLRLSQSYEFEIEMEKPI